MLDSAARLLRLLPAETAHNATLALLGAAWPLLPAARPDDPRLAVRAFGLDFPNPIGLAAGFDKDAEVPDAMAQIRLRLRRMRHGHAPAAGRQSAAAPVPAAAGPRRDQPHGLQQCAAWRRRRAIWKRAQDGRGGIVGINIGANKDSADRIADYALGFAALAPLADYVTVNVSSPNTPGLRGLQNRDELTRLLGALIEARAKSVRRPLLLKIAPDLDEAALDEIADVVKGFASLASKA